MLRPLRTHALRLKLRGGMLSGQLACAQANEAEVDCGNSYPFVCLKTGCNLYKLLTSQLDRGSGEKREVTHQLVNTV